MNKGIENAHKGMITVLTVAVLLLVAAIGTASAATAASEWDATFGGDGTDNAYSVEQTDDGGYVLTGYKAFPDRKLWLLKTNSSGVREWDSDFGGDSSWGRSVRQTDDGGYIVTGYTETYGAGKYDVWLIKTGSSGIESWNKTFGYADQDYGYSVQQTPDDGYILAGATDLIIGSGTQYAAWLIKTDSTGKEEWNQTYDYDTGMDVFYSVQQTSDGGYIAVGYSKNTSDDGGKYGVWLIRTDSTGMELWNKTFGETDEVDYGHEVKIEETSGGYIIGGRTKSYGAGNYDAWLIRTDSNGNELWNKTYGGSSSDSAYSLDSTSDGGYVLTGKTSSYGAGSSDIWLVKTDSNGNEEWDMTFGGSEDDGAYSVDAADDGSYVIAGYTKSIDPGNKDIWLIHTEGPESACVGENYRFTCGDVVNESCTFNADLTCPAATAGLIIGADGITVDGAGHKITGTATHADCEWCGAEAAPCTVSGIYNAGFDDVVIKNLGIENFCTGIALAGTGANRIRNNTVDNCEIHDNGFDTGNMTTHGIHVCNIDGAVDEPALTVTGSEIYNNEGTGSGCGAGGNGIFIYAGTPGTKHECCDISYNKLHDNAKAGFWTKKGLDQSEITHNEVWGNGNGSGITDNVRGGIVLMCKKSNKNLIAHNNVHDHVADGCGYGIYVGGSNNTIEYNNVTNNSKHGISMARSDGSYNNELYENTVCDNGVYDLYVWSPTAGNHGDNNTCDTTSNYDDDGTSGCTYPCGAQGPACVGENYRFTCGDVVNESCTFNADLTCPAATAGLIIGADGITVDGAGHKITGDLAGAACNLCDATNPSTISGIYNAGYDNVVIRNLKVEGFCTGIALKGTGPDKIRNNTIHNCEIHDNGLDTGSEIGTHGIHACWIDVGDGGEPALTITNNDVYNNEGTGSGCGSGGNGIFVFAGAGAKHEKAVISHNNLYGNAKAGFWTKAALDQSEITHNEVWGNGNGTGITDDARGGIILRCKKSNKNLIAHNNVHDHVADGCGYGIYVGGSNNTIEYNNVTNNSKHGISMFRSDGSFNNSLYENRVCDNGVYDLHVWSPTAGNHGDNNTCDTTHDYDDDGTSGCTYSCGAQPPKGDLNGDDKITQADAVIALRIAVSGEWSEDGDVSGDGRVTSLDALLILQWAAGAI